MPTEHFDRAIAITLHNEGDNLVDNPRTTEFSKYGLTLKFLSQKMDVSFRDRNQMKQYIRNLTPELAKEDYKKLIWDPLNFDAIEDGYTAFRTFDLQVNTGRGIVFLQKALNLGPGPRLIKEDGVLGPKTIDEMKKQPRKQIYDALIYEATLYYNNLVETFEYFRPNLTGWLLRLKYPTRSWTDWNA